MELIKVIAVFAAILILLNLKLPLAVGMLGGTILLSVLFGMGLTQLGGIMLKSVTSWGTLEVVLALYVVSVLQCSLERRDHLRLAQESMDGLFRDRRLNVALASMFIGMMPAPAAVNICGEMVNSMAGDHLSKPEKAACASYFRHIPEGVVPTFPQIILACSLSGVSIAAFVAGMIPMVIALLAIGFLFFFRKVPREEDTVGAGDRTPRKNKEESLKNLAKSLWTIFAAIVLILAFDMPAWLAVGLVIVASIFVNHFTRREVGEMIVSAFDWKIVTGTFGVFIFKDVLMTTGIFDLLPGYFSKLPIPTYLTLALLFFFGTLVASSAAVTSAFVPLAFSIIPGGVPLLILILGFSYAANQMTPTHVCLVVVSEHFGISMGALIRKTLPAVLCYCAALVVYYLILGVF